MSECGPVFLSAGEKSKQTKMGETDAVKVLVFSRDACEDERRNMTHSD